LKVLSCDPLRPTRYAINSDSYGAGSGSNRSYSGREATFRFFSVTRGEMSTPSSNKRPAAEEHQDGKARVARPRSRSTSSTEHVTQLELGPWTRQNRPPPSGYDLDRLNYHMRLKDFGAELQKAANAVFPGGQHSRYEKVDVILLSWKDEDPKLPVSLEIRELADTFANLYGYHVEEFLIPSQDSHNQLQVKILQFLWNHNPSHLKIVYYAGHGKLTNHGQPAWTR
jgi:hypothetical protein